MRTSKFSFFALLAAIGLTTSAIAQHPEPTVATVASLSAQVAEAAAVVDAFHDALGKGDQSAAAALLTADAIVFEGGGVERSKAEYASHHLPADAAFASATKRTVTRRTGATSGDFAWIATEATTTGTYRDRAINSVSTETMVLRRENGAWRIAHIHWSSANVK